MLKDWLKIAKLTTFWKWLYLILLNALSISFSLSGTLWVGQRHMPYKNTGSIREKKLIFGHPNTYRHIFAQYIYGSGYFKFFQKMDKTDDDVCCVSSLRQMKILVPWVWVCCCVSVVVCGSCIRPETGEHTGGDPTSWSESSLSSDNCRDEFSEATAMLPPTLKYSYHTWDCRQVYTIIIQVNFVKTLLKDLIAYFSKFNTIWLNWFLILVWRNLLYQDE